MWNSLATPSACYIKSEKKHPKKSNTKIFFCPPIPLQNSLCLNFSYISKRKHSPNTKNFGGWRPLKRWIHAWDSWWNLCLGGHFGPEKKYLAPPPPKFPNSPQTPSRPLGPSRPGTPPPPGIFNKNQPTKPPPPPPGASNYLFPLPEQKKRKNIRNVHQVVFGCFFWPWLQGPKTSNRDRKFSPKFFWPNFLQIPWARGRPRLRAMDVRTQMLVFSRILRALTEVLGRDIRANEPRMSAGYLSQKLPLWADFSFLIKSAHIIIKFKVPSLT